MDEHAALKYSGHIGRTGSDKRLDEKNTEFSGIAHIRYYETEYDELLAEGCDQRDALFY
jgi:hypothetical protein|tara:strand:- start:165 stop:341 length:177 start_codon:yes stop_codon:yes gene_type:complete